jgi:hypothetical protein
MTGRNHWVENIRCPQCGKTGTVALSMADCLSWAVQVDSISQGF